MKNEQWKKQTSSHSLNVIAYLFMILKLENFHKVVLEYML